jgi:putative acetyltransferase
MTRDEAIRIVGYDDAYAAAFERLNRAWLEHYGLFEPGDRPYLEQPRQKIIEPGGEIFFALRGSEVVGTCAALPRDQTTVELVKLAVLESARGRGLGRKLTEAVIEWARRRQARKLVLVSSTKLQQALRLYERLGFRYGELPADTGYETADIYMELTLY